MNYERMMSMAYTYSMLPWLKENYKGNPEGLKKSVKDTFTVLSNCSPYMNPGMLWGVNMGIGRDREKRNSLDAVMAIKTGLMGPLPVTGRQCICCNHHGQYLEQFAANMALNGSVAGIFHLILWKYGS